MNKKLYKTVSHVVYVVFILCFFASMFYALYDPGPEVPKLPAFNMELPQGDTLDIFFSQQPLYSSLYERFLLILESAPFSEFKEWRNMFMEKKFFVAMHGTHNDSPAAFMVWTGAELKTDKRFLWYGVALQNDEYYPTIYVAPVVLTKTDPRIIRTVWLVLRHEYEHYLQYLKASPEQKEYHQTDVWDENKIQDRCSYMWDVEFDAHHTACVYAKEWQVDKSFAEGICETVEDPVKFLETYQQSMLPHMRTQYPQCKKFW